MIQNIKDFLQYFNSIRRRTIIYAEAVPPEQLDWVPKPGELSCRDILWHLAAAENMFVGAVATGKWHYSEPVHQIDAGLEEILTHLQTVHETATATLQSLADTVLYQPRPTLNGPDVKAWRLLLAMVEHEVHHRSQLAVYLALIGVEPPQIYGLKMEEIIAITGETQSTPTS